MTGHSDVHAATSAFGKAAKAKLASVAVSGQPEDQLRGPEEAYVRALGAVSGLEPADVVLVGESALSDFQCHGR